MDAFDVLILIVASLFAFAAGGVWANGYDRRDARRRNRFQARRIR